MHRRNFLSGAALAAPAIFAASTVNMPEKNLFVHHVYFWLKNPGNETDLKKLAEGLVKLTKIKTIKMYHIGKPADTDRGVIDTSYSLSWLTIFENKAGQDSYQTDPIHLKFVEECAGLWSKVVVYDSVDFLP
ncbi:MAG TPA: Dabb family protein [Chitinophagaceae bacterium]